MPGASRCAPTPFGNIGCKSFGCIIRVHHSDAIFFCVSFTYYFQSLYEQITKYAGRMQCAPTPFGYIGCKSFGCIIRVHHSDAIFFCVSFTCYFQSLYEQITKYAVRIIRAHHFGTSFGHIIHTAYHSSTTIHDKFL
jgi:hypothetical protein